MLSSNKIKYIVLTLVIAGAFLLYQTNQESAGDDLGCTGTVRKNAYLKDDSEAIIDTTVYLLIQKNNQGIVNYNGAVTHDGKRYKVSRSISFTYAHEKESSVYRFMWRDMNISGEDTLPPELGFMAHPEETKSYFRLRKIDENMLTVNKNGFPLFVCVSR